MRRTTLLSSLALAATTLALAGPATAMPDHGEHGPAAKAGLTCYAGVVGAESDKHVRYDSIKNGKVTGSVRSKARLGFPVTAWGFFDLTSTKSGGAVLRLDAVAKNGVPRQVSITQDKKGKIIALGSTAFDQKSFEPDLFTEGDGYYAYTIDNGVLKQWVTTRLRNGKLKYTHPVKIGNGYDAVTALQATYIYKDKGVVKEIAYATTSEGALLQLDIPQKKPQKTKTKVLADTGYAGVTELVSSFCNEDREHIWLAAIDPAADTATWTTVKDVLGKPTATLQGEITGSKGWDLTAAF
jgi:hypothetical protein